MRGLEIKGIPAKVEDVDTTGRRVVFYASAFENTDLDQDIMMPGAYTKSIREKGKAGTNRIVHLADHTMTTECLLSRDIEFEQDSYGLKCISNIVRTQKGNDILEQYLGKAIDEHSVGFTIPKDKSKKENGVRKIYEADLWEVSSVVFGANPLTPTIGVKSFTPYTVDHLEELEKSWQKLLKDSNMSDESMILFDLRHKQLLSTIAELKATQPTIVTEPDIVVPDPVADFYNSIIQNF